MSRIWPAPFFFILPLSIYFLLVVATRPGLGENSVASTGEELAGLSEAIATANAALSSISDFQIVLGGEASPALPHVVHTSVLIPDPFAGPQPAIQTVPGQTYIFIQPTLLLQRIQEMKIVRKEDVDGIGAAIEAADLSGGTFPKRWTEEGIKLMREAKFSNSDVLTALLLHEVGHMYCKHAFRGDIASSGSGSNTDASAAKRVEAEADQFAATALVSTLLGDDPKSAEQARRAIDNLTMIGFRYAADRLRAGQSVIVDDSETHENLELRVVRMFDAVTAAVPWAGDFHDDIVGIIQNFDSMRALLADERPDPVVRAPCKIPAVKRDDDKHITPEATLLQPTRELMKQKKYGQAAQTLVAIIASKSLLWDPADPQRLRFYLYYANALYLNAQYIETKRILADALRIVDALGLRDKTRGVQVIGPLAVVDRYFLLNTEADALCDELRGRDIRSLNPPDEFLMQLEWTCRGGL